MPASHYVEVTADRSVLDEVVPFIDGPAIPDGAEDAYYAPQISSQTASVYEHGARTIDRSLATGVHGLPLMGTGDWNDGMNRVGHEGRGESVWLAWFLCSVVERFAPFAQARGEHAARATLAGGAQGLDRRPARRRLGRRLVPARLLRQRRAARLVAQRGMPHRPDRAGLVGALGRLGRRSTPTPALASMKAHLHDEPAGLLRLLHPPLAHSPNNPGYIQAYPPGVRENGGQYSHAAVWALMAQALHGDAEAAWHSFEGLSPAHRAQPSRSAARPTSSSPM